MSERYVAGDTVQLELTVTRDGEPVNLTGMTIRFALGNHTGVVGSTEDGSGHITVAVTDAAAGEYVVTMLPALTSALLGTYRYQSEVEDSSDGIATVLDDWVTFTRDLIV